MSHSILMQGVSKAFERKTVLNDVSLTVNEGEIFGLLGPSGAGKTTLIKILTGQLSYDGKSEILGIRSECLTRKHYAQIGMMLDNSGIYERLSCYDNLLLFCRLYGINKCVIKETLALVGLHQEKKIADKLSKGMKQRLILARALLNNPKILFLDEPTSGLDPTTAKEIHQLLLNLKKAGTTIFLTTHNMEEAYHLCNNIALLHEGSIVEYGAPKVLCRKYNTKNCITILCRDGSSVTFDNTPNFASAIANHFLTDNVIAIHSSEPTLGTVFMTLTGKELDV